MNKYFVLIVGVLAGVFLSATAAFATGVFDPSTPPTHTVWMDRPCKKVQAGLYTRPDNCYWNDTMGLTDAQGNDIHTGFWIWRVGGQGITCYIYSPDDLTGHKSHCYGRGLR